MAVPADDCDRLRTITNINATDRDQDFIPRFPELNENPSLRIREKNNNHNPIKRNPNPQ